MAHAAPAETDGQATDARRVRVGVLALQGSFREHMATLRRLPKVEAVEVRTKEQLSSVDALIIPGGSKRRTNMAKRAASCACTPPCMMPR